MSLVVPFAVLFALVALVAVAFGKIVEVAFSADGRVRKVAEQISPIVAAMFVMGCVVAAAVAFPHTAVGFFARTPEHVEVSALVAAVAGALVHSFRQHFGTDVRPGA